jgi:hypothetical protein
MGSFPSRRAEQPPRERPPQTTFANDKAGETLDHRPRAEESPSEEDALNRIHSRRVSVTEPPQK